MLFVAASLLAGPAARGAVADHFAAPGTVAPIAAPGTTGAGTADPTVPVPAADPDFPYVGYLRANITGIAPIVVTADSPDTVTVTGTVTNVSEDIVYDLRYVWQRGSALSGVKAIRAEIARPGRDAAVVGEESHILAPTTGATKQTDLAPGRSAAFVATAPVGAGGLRFSQRGVYALTIKVSGDIGQNGNTDYERVGEIHLLSTVLSLPSAPPVAGRSTGSAATPTSPTSISPGGTFDSESSSGSPTATTVLWPLVDRPHLGVGGTFLDDSLAASIAPGGRLDGVLAAITGFDAVRGAVTLVVDPELLAELEAMAAGYRVVSTPGIAQPALTPTSERPTTSADLTTGGRAAASAGSSAAAPGGAGSPASSSPQRERSSIPASTPIQGGSTPPIAAPAASSAFAANTTNTVPGRGRALAAAFLTRLRAAARVHQVLVLPYSDPDSVAMVRAGLDDELAALVPEGRTVAARVLHMGSSSPPLITDTAIPAGGSIDDATLAFLSAHGIARAVLSPATLRHDGGPTGAFILDERTDQGTVVHAAVTDADVLSTISDVVAKGAADGEATRLSTLAALLTGGSIDGSATPVIIAPDNRWAANAGGLRILNSLLRILATGKVITGTPLSTITDGAVEPATLHYPGTAESAELSPTYLGLVVSATGDIAGISSSLTRAASAGAPAPADLLNPLRASLVAVASAGLRADPGGGALILQTVGSTLSRLRSGVSITSGSPYTLAASTAPLLITVRNDLPYVVRVRVVIIDGATVGMTTTDPALEDIPAGGSHQFRIDASVVKAGRFPVRAQIKAADGSDWSAATTITVSSSAYGALTIVIIVVAGGALTVMVALRLIQRIRSRQRRPGTDAADGGEPDHPEPDSILAAVQEWTPERRSWPGAAPGNRTGGRASVSEICAPSGVPPRAARAVSDEVLSANDQGDSPT